MHTDNPAGPAVKAKRIRGEGQYGRPTYRQAQKIVAKFGGEARFAAAVGISRITAYRYSYSRPYGTDGLVPGHMVDKVTRAARLHGIVLTQVDWIPERIVYQGETSCEAGIVTDDAEGATA